LVTETRPAQAVSGVSPVQSWERYRDDARNAVLARLISTAPVRAPGQAAPTAAETRAAANAPLPAGLVRALVLQTKGASQALVDIAGKAYLVNTRQALNPGSTVVLRLLDEQSFSQAEALGVTTVPIRPGELRAAAAANAAAGTAAPPEEAAAAQAGQAADAARGVRGVMPTPMPALAQLHTETGDAKVELSGSSRLLLALANETATDETATPQRSVPLATLRLDPRADTAVTAQRLQQAVEQSGLFYESHLQQWQDGRRSLDTLGKEPQAALSPGPQGPETDDAQLRAAHLQAGDAPDTPEQSATKGLDAALRAIPDDLRPLVHDQISLLESGRLIMQGAWGEQPFQLEVEPDQSHAQDTELPKAWRVRLTVNTPHLGQTQLDVALLGNATQVVVRPDTKTLRGQALLDAQTLLQSATMELQQALDARGVAMSELTVTTSNRNPVPGQSS
jgi:hypothetical protein